MEMLVTGGNLRNWPDLEANKAEESSNLDYEVPFIVPGWYFSIGASRIPNHGHE